MRRSSGHAGHTGADRESAERLRNVEVSQVVRHQSRRPLRHTDGGTADTASSRATGSPYNNAYSGACRIFCLSYLQGAPPTLYEDGAAIRDYVNIDDVVDAVPLVLRDARAIGRVFNVGGGKADPPRASSQTSLCASTVLTSQA